MAGARVSFLKSGFNHFSQTYSSSMNLTNLTNQTVHVKIPSSIPRFLRTNTTSRIAPFQSLVDKRRYRCEPVSSFPRKCLQNNGLLKLNSWNSIHPLFASSTYRAYSSFFGGKSRDVPRETEYSAASFLNGSDGDTGNVIDRDWVGDLKNSWQSVQDTVVYVGDKAKKASDELFPYAHQLFDSHPYLHNVIIPVSGTLTGTLLAWMVLPRVLRKLHKYSLQGSAALLSGNISDELYPYEKSVWGALEYPVRYLVTFMAFTYLGFMIAPSTITSQYVTEAWRGGVVIAFIAFLYRWKSNYFSRALASQVVVGLDREKLLALDKISSVGLIVLGLMALAEACGVAVQSILTVGGVGGVATAFAARDILGNMLSGLSMQFSKPFSLGDTIKAGSVEGKVVDMGLTTTSLLSVERFPVIVPNSLFSSQVIVNKSRAQWRAILTKIPLRIDSFEKIPQISEDIKSMLRSNTKIFLGQELPYCYLSRVENSFAELTIGYNLKQMRKDEFYSAQQDILLEATKVINQHGATLGSTQQDSAYQ